MQSLQTSSRQLSRAHALFKLNGSNGALSSSLQRVGCVGTTFVLCRHRGSTVRTARKPQGSRALPELLRLLRWKPRAMDEAAPAQLPGPLAKTTEATQARLTIPASTRRQRAAMKAERRKARGRTSCADVPAGDRSTLDVDGAHRVGAQMLRFAADCGDKGERLRRELALTEVAAAILHVYPKAKLQLFGSSSTGLAVRGSDIDLVLITPEGDRLAPLTALARRLGTAPPAISSTCTKLFLVAHARVPILKLVEKQSGLPIDICANITDGLATSAAIRSDLERWPFMRPLILVLKGILSRRGLNDTYTGQPLRRRLRRFEQRAGRSLSRRTLC